MTSTSLAGAVTLGDRFHPEALVGVLLRVTRVFRPSDGWLAVGLLVLNLLVVVLSVEDADWVPVPDLKLLIIMGMAAGLIGFGFALGRSAAVADKPRRMLARLSVKAFVNVEIISVSQSKYASASSRFLD